MKHCVLALFTASLLTVWPLFGGTAFSCTWAAYHNGKASLVARTMDWLSDDHMAVKGHGRGLAVKAADTPNALTYTAKYASLRMHSFEGHVTDALNDQGLQISVLYLGGSELPAPADGRKDVSCLYLLDFIVSNFATVREAVEAVEKINILPPGPGQLVLDGPEGRPFPLEGRRLPFHLALADSAGDRAAIEFRKGKLQIHHGRRFDALSNVSQEANHALDGSGYQPKGGIDPLDRLARARLYLEDMAAREVADPRRALLAMRGLLASVWAGTEEMYYPGTGGVFPTIWGALVDQNALAYYVSRYNTWCTEKYDFTMFDPNQPEAVDLETPDCPLPKVEVSEK